MESNITKMETVQDEWKSAEDRWLAAIIEMIDDEDHEEWVNNMGAMDTWEDWEGIDVSLLYKEDIEAMAGWEYELTATERKTLCRIKQEFAAIA